MIDRDKLLYAAPQVLKDDAGMAPLAEVIASGLSDCGGQIDLATIYARIDELPEGLLDILAQDFDVFWYDYEANLDAKRATIKDATYIHRHLGTVSAVLRAVADVYPQGRIEEWFEYGGDPYHFRIFIAGEQADVDAIKLNQLIYRVKNVRSILDGIYYTGDSGEAVAWPMAGIGGMMGVGMSMVAAMSKMLASGNPVSISNALAINALFYQVSFGPLQSGSGTPAIDNVLPLSSVSSITIEQYSGTMQNADTPAATYPISLGGNYVYGELTYGGDSTHNFVHRELIEWASISGTTIQSSNGYCDIDSSATISVLTNTVCLQMEMTLNSVSTGSGYEGNICSHLPYIENGGDTPHYETMKGLSPSGSVMRVVDILCLYLPISVGTTYGEILAWFQAQIEAGTPLQIAGTTKSTELSVSAIPMLSGSSQLYCEDASEITVQYYS